MTTTGIPRSASSIDSSTLRGVAPDSSAIRDASWITGPSITGSENGIPTSSAWPPLVTRSRSAPSRSGAKETSDRVEILVTPPGQAHDDGRALRQRTLEQPAERVRGLECRKDSLCSSERPEPVDRVLVGRRRVLGQTRLFQIAVLRSHAGIVQSRR